MNSTGKYISLIRIAFGLLFLFGSVGLLQAQTGTLKGVVTDKTTGEPVISGTVFIIGTYKGALTGQDGSYVIEEIKAGDYSVKISFVGMAEKIYPGITIEAGKTKTLNVLMEDKLLETVIIEGEPNIVDLESGKSEIKLGADIIEETNAQNVQDIVAMQVGVSETPDGLVIRGGRVYETKYMIDGISAKDPLAGTGFGVNVGAEAISEISIITGGGDVEFGDGTSGVINTRLKEGGQKLSINGSYYRDNFGFNKNQGMSWNTDRFSISANGPIPFTKKKVLFYVGATAAFSDEYFNIYADQLHSSMFSNSSMWAPRQDNRWSNTSKLTYNIKPGMKISLSNQHSLNINQSTRSLQIIGNDAIMRPGFQYSHSLNLDNANTYTHHSNLTILNYKQVFKDVWTMDLTVGRLFTNLRADANGRPFRESTVDRLFDPASIVTDPVDVSNPDDSVVYVFPGPGLYNNDGIATLWHDHYAQEYTFKYKFTKASNNGVHFLTFGQEHREQEYQWIDVTRPWVGAPIQIDSNTTTVSSRLGSSSDVWKARPAVGGFFLQDEIRYKGIIAFIGARFEYFSAGKFVDDAVNNPEAPVTDEIREQYLDQTVKLFARRWKARLLPKLRVSFPVTDNNVLYFNYGHSTQMPHPRFLYAGLDPVYQDRSFLSNLGNPNLNPEVSVNYEVGLKSQITKDLAFTITAYYNDKFDYIVSRRLLIRDQTGRFVEKTFYINQDYARIRGIEVSLTKRVKKWLRAQFTGSYQIATGKSNSAAESALQIKQQGFVATSKEQYLAWDRPMDLKLSVIFKPDSTIKLFGLSLKGFRVFLSSTLKSGLRYTPYALTDTLDTGRPVYERIEDEPFSKIASPWFWTDLKISRDFHFSDRGFLSLSIEFQNIFNNKNSQIINGVTGKAYEEGDPLPIDFRDPNYPDPQDNGSPPFNPARYLQPRHMLFGLKFQF